MVHVRKTLILVLVMRVKTKDWNDLLISSNDFFSIVLKA